MRRMIPRSLIGLVTLVAVTALTVLATALACASVVDDAKPQGAADADGVTYLVQVTGTT